MQKFSLTKLTISSLFIVLVVGCSGEKIMYKTYSSPYKKNEVQKMKDAVGTNSGYLNIEVVAAVANAEGIQVDKSFKDKLVVNLKKFLTQTNFIQINDIEDESTLSLDMKVLNYVYEKTQNSIRGQITVEFNIRKNTTFYTQDYTYNVNRFSRAGSQGLPSKDEILTEASKYLAKKLVKDISPIRTMKLVELKSLPSEIAYTVNYAKSKNYDSAIKGMLQYKGEKDASYYFDLAVYYEGLASQTDNLALLAKADKYYTKALSLSKGGDEVIIQGKGKFDNYYKIIKEVAEQKLKNAQKTTDSQYEIL